MTSVLKRYAQIDPRVQFFTVLADCSGWTLDANETSSPLMTTTAFNAAYTEDVRIPVCYLLKDLGRSITVYDPTTSAHVAVFRQIMQVKGPVGNEGNSTFQAYICTWDDGSGLYNPAFVARTG